MGEEGKETEEGYSLVASKKGLGELVPVIKDKFGNIIDGFHRKGENQNWREETLDWIDTPEKLEAARLAVNFNRRRMAPEEIKERIAFLAKKGLKTKEISELTGVSERTIQKYTPQELKNQAAVEMGKMSHKAVSAEALHFTNVNPEVAEVVPQTAKTIASAPGLTPTAMAQQPKTSDTAYRFDGFSPCKGCHTYTRNSVMVEGLCPFCVSKAEAKAKFEANEEIRKALGQPPAPVAESKPILVHVTKISTESSKPETVEAEDVETACPCCGSILDPQDYAETRTEVGIKYGRLVQQKLFPEESEAEIVEA